MAASRSAVATKPVAVNDQVVDSLTIVSAKLLAESPSMALGSIFQSQAHSLGIA
ncbi:killing trait family protein [Lysobacter capsici]|nr:killing trait family protein [Lysobacter capsici]